MRASEESRAVLCERGAAWKPDAEAWNYGKANPFGIP
jgi:hypothetical protein